MKVAGIECRYDGLCTDSRTDECFKCGNNIHIKRDSKGSYFQKPNKQNTIYTNADRIRNMDNIELAKYLSELDGGGIVRFKKFREWLDSEVE